MAIGVQPVYAAIVSAATDAGATIVRSHGSTIIVLPAHAPAGDDLLSLAEAAELARCSVRTLQDARRAGVLRMFGGQRDRTTRRSDLLAWIETRSRSEAGADDLDIARRVRRRERATRTA